jgi:hypothetical protein
LSGVADVLVALVISTSLGDRPASAPAVSGVTPRMTRSLLRLLHDAKMQ